MRVKDSSLRYGGLTSAKSEEYDDVGSRAERDDPFRSCGDEGFQKGCLLNRCAGQSSDQLGNDGQQTGRDSTRFTQWLMSRPLG